MFCGFQPSGFQNNAYEIITIFGNSSPAPNGNKEYVPSYYELQRIERLNKIEHTKARKQIAENDLRAKEWQIEELELKRLREGLADQRLQAELLELFLERQQILLAQAELERLILEMMEEDEAIVVILLTLPF